MVLEMVIKVRMYKQEVSYLFPTIIKYENYQTAGRANASIEADYVSDRKHDPGFLAFQNLQVGDEQRISEQGTD